MINVKKSVISCLLACGSLNLLAQNAYDIIELGDLDDNSVFAFSINNSNKTVGYSYTSLLLSGTFTDVAALGFISQDGLITGLGAIDNSSAGTDPIVSRSAAFSLNDGGVATGYSLQTVTKTSEEGVLTTSSFERATYTDTSDFEIGLVPPFVADDIQNMRALSSNENGLVVGFGSFDPIDDVNSEGASRTTLFDRGFIYDSNNDQLTRIDPLDNKIDEPKSITLRDINKDGVVIAVSSEILELTSGSFKVNARSVYIDTNDSMTVKDMSLSNSDRQSFPFAINENKVVVGKRNIDESNFSTAYIYDINSDMLQDIPELREGYRPQRTFDLSIAYDINKHNQVVGTAVADVVPDLFHAFIYENDAIKDLNNLIDCKMNPSEAAVGEPDWILYEARSINDYGYIVGNGYLNNERKAFMLVPRTDAPVLCPVAEIKKGSGSVPYWLSSMLILMAVFRKKLIK